MAARRLVIVMIVLLAISTIAAALVPPPNQPTTTSIPTRSRPQRPPRAGARGLVRARVHAAARHPAVVLVRPGDELQLRVDSPRPDEIEIPAFGLVKVVEPVVPASFDFLVQGKGT